ncbi:pyridoxal-phosphate dependent enzyme [Desemzia sp. RIT804]|uniref:1-aminocyclopropane-1-carboxylate deaminase/D-cysteine desulfhydrase n=1 Tax=Desemzia sp. RIT 804 TaxID=2810209 RepID=UPI001951EA6C|nr:pyridoxal-phosphate dependent enzyme [Desemzia sp. RIT 804]MBM6614825.1 pyridoxal-phosphate dependent enzyme [Desemzia sp. RIT 804]
MKPFFTPTPIQQLTETFQHNRFYMKREDLIPLSFGGNKARKAYYFLQDMEQQQANCLVTYGSSSSNHCRVIAAVAAAKGYPCLIISPSSQNTPTMNQRLVETLNAKLIFTPLSQVRDTIQQTIEQLKQDGLRPYFIQGGGHGHNGTQAYVDAYHEIKTTEAEENLIFDMIFHASGTGTTQAGLICGNHLSGDTKKIVGISIARDEENGRPVVLESATSYLENHSQPPLSEDAVIFDDRYRAGGYGKFHEGITEIIKQVFIHEGIALDPTYTGKAYWGMMQYIKEHQIEHQTILFVHTGSNPLFFDQFQKFSYTRSVRDEDHLYRNAAASENGLGSNR